MRHLLIRNAEVEGRIVDIAIRAGRIVDVRPALAGEELIDAACGAVIPGLHDHHIHLLATAAARQSVRLEGCADAIAVARCLRDADAALPPNAWLRATGYHERIAGPLDRLALDQWLPRRPVRVQDQTGALWMLNSAAVMAIPQDAWPEDAERDGAGILTGRVFRGDAWLGEHIERVALDLAALGCQLAGYGLTGVTDASVTTDAASAGLLGQAVRTGLLPLRLTLMSGGALSPPSDGAYAVGPVKILLDDDRLPTLDALVKMIEGARDQGRAVAAHCVTAAELAIMLAAFDLAGSRNGDRIEHGSIIPRSAICMLRDLGLTVVTQPGFIATRGERYRALVDPAEQADLYRCATLIARGVPVGGSSDAPYGNPDPWSAIRAASDRRTADGHFIGVGERVSAARALRLYLTPSDNPGGAPRRIRAGTQADLCILHVGMNTALADPTADHVAATLLGGRITHHAARHPGRPIVGRAQPTS
jgi:predicted amidohydrolase YtcJ